MSSTKATKALLERAGHRNALTTEQILAAIQKGGLEIGGKNPASVLYKNLWRDDDFTKVGKGLWGLSAWYGTKKKRARQIEGESTGEEPTEAAEAAEPAEPEATT